MLSAFIVMLVLDCASVELAVNEWAGDTCAETDEGARAMNG